MKQRSSFFNLLMIILAASPLIYLALIWHSIPPIVPVHYDLNFKPDRMDKKNMLWVINGMFTLVSILVYFLLLNIHRFDPKRSGAAPSATFKRLAVVIVVFITALNFLFIVALNNHIELMHKLLFPLIGLLFAFIGNYMNNLKPNYFAGLRLPWTLSSDYNWRKTHHLASKLWFWGGISAAIISFLTPSPYSQYIFFCILFVIIIIPVVYSYQIFKQEKKPDSIT
ncbi:MAG: SdpI family protein [Chitinophagaceae bacterium]|nr:SdpI family protein [Chitinophagaceae bacterium]